MALKLVQPQEDRATVEELTKLLEKAKTGAIVGLAFVAMHQGGEYSGDVIGRAKAFPVYTLGLIRALEAIVHRLI